MMTREQMITLYEALSAADAYILGFTHKHNLYYVQLDKLPDEVLKRDRSSASRGAVEKVRVRVNSATRAAFLDSGRAVLVGSDELLNCLKNRGDAFEKVMKELLMGVAWSKDSTPFWKAGDIQVGGKEVQVKLDGASLTDETTLTNAVRDKLSLTLKAALLNAIINKLATA